MLRLASVSRMYLSAEQKPQDDGNHSNTNILKPFSARHAISQYYLIFMYVQYEISAVGTGALGASSLRTAAILWPLG